MLNHIVENELWCRLISGTAGNYQPGRVLKIIHFNTKLKSILMKTPLNIDAIPWYMDNDLTWFQQCIVEFIRIIELFTFNDDPIS